MLSNLANGQKISDITKGETIKPDTNFEVDKKAKAPLLRIKLPNKICSQQYKKSSSKVSKFSISSKILKVSKSTNSNEVIMFKKKKESYKVWKKSTLNESKRADGSKDDFKNSFNKSLCYATPSNQKHNSRNGSQYFKSTTNDNTEVNLPVFQNGKKECQTKANLATLKSAKKSKHMAVLNSKKNLSSLKIRIQQLYDKYFDPMNKTLKDTHDYRRNEEFTMVGSPDRPHSRNVNITKMISLPPLNSKIQFCSPTKTRNSSFARCRTQCK
ncbi:unnamed protein product [Moneuplotes crassus]|uniref:Uncharacterized protein n=1 Tax=Euplotes crassus TaxID=5936 RepID=A0AAD1UC26_EUPCR|nr:unnamed protein product [Moneuplotes crassus]